MTATIDIRPLGEHDAQDFRDLRLRGLQEHPEAFGELAEDFAARPVEQIAERLGGGEPGALTLGAFLDGRLVGTAGVAREKGVKFRHKGYIWGMYVAPEARGRGLGRRLLAMLIDHARQVPELRLLTLGVTVGNRSARALYIEAGFASFGVEPECMAIGDSYYDMEWMYLRLR